MRMKHKNQLFTQLWPLSHKSSIFQKGVNYRQDLGAVHVETLLCVNAHVLHRFGLFWNLVSGWKNVKTPPLRSRVDSESTYFAYRWCHFSAPRPLNPATSHNNNNNGGLHACVGAAEDIEPFRVTTIVPLLLHWAKKNDNHQLAIFIFFLSCSVSSSTVCLYTVHKLHAHAPSLLLCFGEFQAPPIGWNMNYSALSCFQWIRLDANILETMPRKAEERQIVWYMWTCLNCENFLTFWCGTEFTHQPVIDY